MKKHIKNILVLWLFWVVNLVYTFWIVVQIPTPSGQEDIVVTWPTQVESNESTIFDVIQIINDYLWFAIAGVAMLVVVYAWFNLITAHGDKDKTSSATRMVISAMIAIIVSMLSYAIIKLVVNLF